MANTKPLASQIRYGHNNSTNVDSVLKKTILKYTTFLDAQNAASTLSNSQLIWAPNENGRHSQYKVQNGTLVFDIYTDQLKVDIIKPEGNEPVGGFTDYSDLQSYSGQATETKILADGHYGSFYKLPGQTLAPIIGRVIIDADGNPWVRRIRNGIVRLSWSCTGLETDDATEGFISAVENSSGYTIHGDPWAKYKIRQKVITPSNTTIRLNGATLIDDVQGRRGPDHGNRPDALFFTVGVENVLVENFKYRSLPTRVQDDENMPVGILWIGDQVGIEDTAVTQNICFRNFSATDMPESAIFCSVTGESRGVNFENVNLYGDCMVGVNFEYGLAASGPNYPQNYGKHPHNCSVRNFNGFNNTKSLGFLRTASAYGIDFEDCQGFNVKAFIYCWTGDRSINRFAQSVLYARCNHFATPDFMTGVPNVTAQILSPDEDGSTGDPLPEWTNQHHLIELKQCDLQTNKVTGSCAVRVYGIFGTVRLTDVAYEGGDYGLRVGPSLNPTHGPNNALFVSGGFMRNNNCDVDLLETSGAFFEQVEFMSQALETNIRIHSSSSRNRFSHCKFPIRNRVNNPHVSIDASSLRNSFYDNDFPGATAPSIASQALVCGANNTGANLSGFDYSNFGIVGQVSTMECEFPSGVTELNARARRIYNVGSGPHTANVIHNGEVGDEVIFTTTLGSSSLTLVNNAYPGDMRIFTKTGADTTITGSAKIVVLKRTGLGWIET